MVSRFLYEMWEWKTFAAATATVLVVVSCWFAVSDELKDRATAAAYSQTLKDQRAERARTTKEIAELRDRVDTLIRHIQASGGTIPAEAFNSGPTIQRHTPTRDDDDDDGDSITVNNPPREDKNPTPKAPDEPSSSPPPNTVEELTKRVEDAVDDLPNIGD